MTKRLSLSAALTAALLWLALALGPVPARAQVALDLRDADIRAFVQIVAEATGRNFVLDPSVQGRVSVIAPAQVSSEAVYEIFLNVLELNRLTLVPGAGADRIVPIGTARELAAGAPGSPLGGGYETRVIQIRNVPPAEIAEVIRPLLPAEAVLTAVPASRLLILSDRRENQTRIANLIAELDRPREQAIDMIRLNIARAGDVAQILTSLGIVPEGATVTPDPRANAILVTGPAEFRARVRDVITQLDQPRVSTTSRVVQLNYADAAPLAEVVLASFGAQSPEAGDLITIVPETRSNALLVTAPSDRIDAIVAAIRALDQRPSQVLVEAVIFEMSVEGFSDLSVQFGGILNNMIAGGVQFSLEGRATLTGVVSAVLTNTSPNVGSGGIFGGGNRTGDDAFVAFLTAIASQTATRLLSTPSIMTLNNEEAEIVVAQNVPFVTGQFSTIGDNPVPEQPFQTIERQDIGLTLRVTPQINADNTVRLEIDQEVSNLTRTIAAAGGEITAKRTLSTNVLVSDGNVIILGGLLENGSGVVSQRVPALSRLPVLGALFRGRNVTRNQRVLLVMLRPSVIRSDAEARRISRIAAAEAERASRFLQPDDDGTFPRVPNMRLPFDGADLNQPFDAGFVDGAARDRRFPPLPTRLRFQNQ